MAKLKATPMDIVRIDAIGRRFLAIPGVKGIVKGARRYTPHWRMNLTACHLNGCPLDLWRLLAADDSSLCHDMFGIDAHINRDTGRLERRFRPRFAKKTRK